MADKGFSISSMVESKRHDLLLRIVINGLSTLFVAFLIFFGAYPGWKWLFTAVVSAISAVAFWEYAALLKKKGLFPAISLGIVAAILYVFASFLKTQTKMFPDGPQVVLGLSFFGCFLYFAFRGKEAIFHIGTTFLGIVYIAVPLGLLVRIMYFFEGKGDLHFAGSFWIIYLIAVTKASDMGGYFIGRAFGKHKLAVKLSPNKTLEGAIGGLLVSIAMSFLIFYLGKNVVSIPENLSYFIALSLGALMGIFGQLGDLAESLLKRDAKVKDSSSIPAVGGILDMLDSLLFTSPILYIFLRVLYTL